jgi:hypothetical protein
MADSRSTYQGNTKGPDVGSLIRRGADDQEVLAALKDKYNDKELVAKAFAEYEERMSRIKRKAQKFAQLVLTRYNHLGTKRIMEKAMKLKKKYNFPDDDFAAFVNLALSDKSLSQFNTYNIPNTPLSKTLGFTQDTVGKMSYSQNELGTLQEILKLHGDTVNLHQMVVVQSLLYRDCAAEALIGTFDRMKHNAYNHVHPIVAALFLPRFKYLDEHMLIGSISNIVVSRYNGSPIKNQPDWELYWDMIVDPNELACASSSAGPVADLKNRALFQVELWKSVKELRQGRYYSLEVANFMTALHNCRTGLFDSPDMAYIKDEGTILRKLFGAFSLRPTIVSISPFGGSMTGNFSINPLALTQVTSVPIINFRLPVNMKGANMTVNLREALEQPDWYVENKMIVTKMKNIIHSRDILAFYVNRRSQNINFGRIVAPYNFTLLPTSFSGFETINSVNVAYDPVIPLGEELFQLRSTIFLEKVAISQEKAPNDPTPSSLIIGCSAGVVIPRDFNINRTEPTYIIYDPLLAGTVLETADGTPITDTKPITVVDETSPLNGAGAPESFESRCRTRGTIYLYAKVNRAMN